jgi:arsenite-transporting ATPase
MPKPSPIVFLEDPPRILLFTGKGGVGKTSVACATALRLVSLGRRVLLVSTDPASNLDEVLGVALGASPTPVPGAPGLSALNIDPVAAAAAYRERLVGPYRALLPAAAVRSIEEQLSGACTVEIAAFDEFSKLLGDPAASADFDHVVFDTAPTGHTLRLLELPAAWSGFLGSGGGSASCLGPLAGLEAQRGLYASSRAALEDRARTLLVLVARAESAALREAERTRAELAALGIGNLALVINGRFLAGEPSDPVAAAFQRRDETALAALPRGLAALPRLDLPLLPFGLVGLQALERLLPDGAGLSVPALDMRAERPGAEALAARNPLTGAEVPATQDLPPGLESLLPELERPGHGAILTMGKGGVGKTTVAVTLALELARRGHRVHLTTTDPAAHVSAALIAAAGERLPPGLTVDRIDPAAEVAAYSAEVLAKAGAALDPAGRALLEEDLRSPCTEEIAVFQAFARRVDRGRDAFVVIDTAPTGHSLLLLDAAESYHREVERSSGAVPEEVRRLLPRLRDPEFTRILLITLPEATPVHEAVHLQSDLGRAGIRPFAWVINQSLSPLSLRDPLLLRRRAHEARYIAEVLAQGSRVALLPWSAAERAPASQVVSEASRTIP